MALIFQDPAATPGTHALVLGVGRYTHLDEARLGQLGLARQGDQLASAVASARAFLDWITGSLRNPAAPLASVELVLSPGGPWPVAGGGSVTVEPARCEAVCDAVVAWYLRANSHRDNVALLYYAGHGAMCDRELLLCEDFGKNPLNPFEQALDIQNLFLSMAACEARTQCFFLDTCSIPSWDAERTVDVDARNPLKKTFDQQKARDAVIYFACEPRRQAFAEPGKVSRFTRALLDCLDGRAAVKASRLTDWPWVVTTTGLGEALDPVMQQQGPDLPEQHPFPRGSPMGAALHYSKQAPRLPVTVEVSPPERGGDVDLELTRVDDRTMAAGGRADGGRWTCQVPAFIYQLGVRSASSAFAPWTVPEPVWVMPTTPPVSVKVP